MLKSIAVTEKLNHAVKIDDKSRVITRLNSYFLGIAVSPLSRSSNGDDLQESSGEGKNKTARVYSLQPPFKILNPDVEHGPIETRLLL